MAQRKLQQEVDRCFKRVAEGITAFEGIFDKIQQTSNQAQKEKLEDALKREIKKLQRQRDQIKTWAASNEIKDKKPLLEQRKLIETQMEKFKAVEKEMKTKAYSKEGLSAAAKLDPKEKERQETGNFLSSMVEELERQIETLEAEAESLQVTVRKGKKDSSKADRVSEIERLTERHKWHQSKLEQMLRALENGGIETEQITELEESIRYYVENNQDVDFMEDDAIYDDLNLDEEDNEFGGNNDNDRVSSQDAQSVQEETPETEGPRGGSGISGKPKSTSVSEPPGAAARRPSMHTKSPLPVLATLHNPINSTAGGGIGGGSNMKPAPLPTRAPGETLKYASAAAAAASSDKNGVGIAPLPPPPGSSAAATSGSNTSLPGLAPLPPAPGLPSKASATTSPAAVHSQPTSTGGQTPATRAAVLSSTGSSASTTAGSGFSVAAAGPSSRTAVSSESRQASAANASGVDSAAPTSTGPAETYESENETARTNPRGAYRGAVPRVPTAADSRSGRSTAQPPQQPNGTGTDDASADGTASQQQQQQQESIYHLPPSLQDLVQSFETTKSRVAQQQAHPPTAQTTRHLLASALTCPSPVDAEQPRPYFPTTRYATAPHYPQHPLPTLEDARLYSRVDTDTLFYVFYYRQGTYQQYLAAKALKNQSWRFHKQYQTWFQRHEEPKTITEEFEQGTYRFFDYESTW